MESKLNPGVYSSLTKEERAEMAKLKRALDLCEVTRADAERLTEVADDETKRGLAALILDAKQRAASLEVKLAALVLRFNFKVPTLPFPAESLPAPQPSGPPWPGKLVNVPPSILGFDPGPLNTDGAEIQDRLAPAPDMADDEIGEPKVIG